MKLKIVFNGKSKPLTLDIEIFDTLGSKDEVTTPEDFRSWLNNRKGDFISIGKRIINMKNVEYFEVLK